MKSKALFLLYSFLIVFSFLASIDGMQINYLESDFFQSYYKIQNHIRSGKNINDVFERLFVSTFLDLNINKRSIKYVCYLFKRIKEKIYDRYF